MDKKDLFLRKPIHHEAATAKGGHQLKRHLKSMHLVAIGIGAIIGAGIFVITGQAAALYAGPAVTLSFVVAALICVLAGMCYAELSALIPISGGSYTYAYVAMGEFPAWTVGWALMMQLLVSGATVSVGWSGYFVSFLRDFGLVLPKTFTHAPFAYDPINGLSLSGALINVPAMALIVLLIALITIGIRAAAYFNHVMVVIKLFTVILFIIIGIPYINSENWIPFIPDNTGHFGEFGLSGIFRGAGLVFFAYIGFETVATLAQDAQEPQKSVPRGILGSLFICTAAYIITCLVLTGVVNYTLLNVPDPMTVALNAFGPKMLWLTFIVKVAILAGLASVVLVQLLGQTRIFFAIGKDGLIPHAFCHVHPTLQTPVFATIITGFISIIVAALFPVDLLGQLVSMTTLFLFVIVSLGVLILRYTHPEVKRPFKTPWVPYLPLLGIVACILQMLCLPAITWVQLTVWLLLGLFIYFAYGFKHSALRKEVGRHPRSTDQLY